MCVTEKELLYLFSTITQSLAAMLGIGIIAAAYLSEKRKDTITRLWNLATEYLKSQNLGTSELSYRGITTTRSLLRYIKRNIEEIKKKKPDLHTEISKTVAEYQAQPKIEKTTFRVSLILTIIGMIFSTVGLIFTSELSNTIEGKVLAVAVILIFIIAIVLFVSLILSAILPRITLEKVKKKTKEPS